MDSIPRSDHAMQNYRFATYTVIAHVESQQQNCHNDCGYYSSESLAMLTDYAMSCLALLHANVLGMDGGRKLIR